MSFTKHRLRSGSLSSSGRVSCSKLLGIDSSISANEVSMSRADGKSYFYGYETPGTVNMIRTGLGEISKRPGYVIHDKIEGITDIGGVFSFTTSEGEQLFYISHNKLIHGDKVITMAEDFNDCFAVQSGEHILFFNGTSMYIYNTSDDSYFFVTSNGLNNIYESDIAYLPTVFIAGTPEGGGAAYQPVNLINPFVEELYTGDGSSASFKLHFTPQSSVDAFIKNESGEWVFQSSTLSGDVVTFAKTPSKPALTGEDNVRFVYRRSGFEETAEKIVCSSCAALFGIGGYEDRVFVAGGGAAGTVYYSEPDNPLYFPDLNYIKVGSAGTRVAALAGQGLSLAVICNDNVYTVSGQSISDNEDTDYTETALFTITDALKTPAPYCIKPVVFDNEINYITADGVCALTASGVLDERCCQIRSSFINYHLLKEELSDCVMLTFNDFLVISNRRDTLYLLDGKQFAASGDMPFSHRQYEGYIWKNIPARYMWISKGRLYFSDGTDIFSFNSGNYTNGEYHDQISTNEVQSIAAYWETPYIYCSDFAEYKFFMRLGVLLDGKTDTDGFAFNTDVKVYAKFDNDDWRVVKDYDGARCTFDYGNIDYSRFTYCDKPKSYAVYCRLLHKKGRGIKLRFENTNADEPYTLQGYNIEYIQM